MARYVRNIHTKNYQNLLIGYQVTVENVGDAFLGHSVFVGERETKCCCRLFYSHAVVQWEMLEVPLHLKG